MCLPAIPLAAIAIASTAATSAAQYAGQAQEAKKSNKYNKAKYSETARISMENFRQQTDTTNLRLQQEKEQAGDAGLQATQAAESAISRGTTAAGEAGVEGNSVEQALNDFSRIEYTNNLNLKRNVDWQNQQSYQDLLAARAGAQSNINSALAPNVSGPSPWLAGLNIIGGAASDIYLTAAKYDTPNSTGKKQ